MYRDKNFPAFLKTEFFEKTQFFPFCCVRKYMAGYVHKKLYAKIMLNLSSPEKLDKKFNYCIMTLLQSGVKILISIRRLKKRGKK